MVENLKNLTNFVKDLDKFYQKPFTGASFPFVTKRTCIAPKPLKLVQSLNKAIAISRVQYESLND